ncbi:MAG: response regulator, partial [Pseudomonadota bacterium]
MNNKKDIKVLIVDDDVVDQKALKRQIKSPKRDVEIVDVTSGKEAIDLIKTHRFDCIFLDYMLPDMDGISVLKSIYNKKTGLGPCPVIMLTGQGSQAVVIDAIRYGAQDYLVKENLSRDTLMIAMTKAQEMFDLKLTQSKSEETLLRSQKMEAIGQLTGGIAHDFNNLLTIMFGNLRLMDDALKRDEFDKELCRGKIEKVEKAARRGADLVKRLMLFSRQRALDPVTTDLNEAMIEAQSLLERAVGGSVEIKLFPSEGLWPVNIDPGELEHAIINLGINARDAMPDGGVLTIETENITVIDDDYQTSHDLEAGDYVLISVSDTGSGMDEQTKEKIFDPF